MVRQACGKSIHYIIRLPMVLGYRSRNPAAQVVNRLMVEARKRGTVSVANDVFHSPVYAGCVARMIKSLLDDGHPTGFYHLSNGARVSLHELIQRVFMKLDIKARVVPVPAKFFGPDEGPLNLALGTVKSSMDETWNEAADRFAAEYKRISEARLA
jgi:dTDP-4-dehydrorhamnose reductase